MTVAIIIFTAAVLAALLWGSWRKRQEKQRRKQGIYTIPVDAGYMAVAGCLGVLGYLGVLFIVISLSFDLVERSDEPGWLTWVIVIAMLLGFFVTVGWAVFGIGSSFAPTRLVADGEGIRLVHWRRLKKVVFWDQPWDLEKLTHQSRSRIPIFDYGTEYQVLLRLSQHKKELQLVFDVTGEEVAGLPPIENLANGLHIIDDTDWLRAEINHRYRRRDETPAKPEIGEPIPEFTAIAPGDPLMTAFEFTEEDLTLNRRLLYGPTQVQPLERDKILTLATYLVLAALFGVGVLYSISRLLDGQSFQSAGPLLVVCLLTAGFCLLMSLVTWLDLRSEIQIERISGRIQLQHYSQSGEYWLRVDDEAFQITKLMYDALEDGAYYNLYAARHGVGAQDAQLLSAERLRR